MDTLLWENNVTRCGSEAPGGDFVNNYMQMYGESFDTQEEYQESIADYVACES